MKIYFHKGDIVRYNSDGDLFLCLNNVTRDNHVDFIYLSSPRASYQTQLGEVIAKYIMRNPEYFSLFKGKR